MSTLTSIYVSPSISPLVPPPPSLWSCCVNKSSTLLLCTGTSSTVLLYSFSPDVSLLADLTGLIPSSENNTIRCGSFDPSSSSSPSPSSSGLCRFAVGSFSGAVHLLTPDARLGTLEGPSSEIKSVVYTPSGTLLAATSRDKSCWIWEASTSDPVAVLQGHGGDVKCCLFLGEVKLATGGYDGRVILWGEDEDGDWSRVGEVGGGKEGKEGKDEEPDTAWR